MAAPTRPVFIFLLLGALIAAVASSDSETCGAAEWSCAACTSASSMCGYCPVDGACAPLPETNGTSASCPPMLSPNRAFCADWAVAVLDASSNFSVSLGRRDVFALFDMSMVHNTSTSVIFTVSSIVPVELSAVLLNSTAWLTSPNITFTDLQGATGFTWLGTSHYSSIVNYARVSIDRLSSGMLLLHVSTPGNTTARAVVSASPQYEPDVRRSAPGPVILTTSIVLAACVIVAAIAAVLMRLKRSEESMAAAYSNMIGFGVADLGPFWEPPPFIRVRVAGGESSATLNGKAYDGPIATEHENDATTAYALVVLPQSAALGAAAFSRRSSRAS